VPEINMGQIRREVERCVARDAPVYGVHRAGGDVLAPDRVLAVLREANENVRAETPGPKD
jgi:2-oxoglutarate ferredoxin oxidoreductase subunit alpha